MTSRERIRKAINHEEPDRVPIDCNSQDEIRIVCPTQRIAGLSEEVYDLLGVDTRYIYANAPSSWKLGSERYSPVTEDIILNKPLADYIMDKLVDWNIEMLDGFLSEADDYIEYQWFADDWGVQDGPFISPEMFRETMVPRFKKIISFVKSKTKAKFCMHTCGATYWMMDDLFEMGVDIVHPVQANAKGNEDAARLKRDYGNKLVFHGNTNNRGVFHKSIEEVTADALYRIRHLAPGGGYIFSGGYNIQVNMPPENILALFDTAKEYGVYPIDTKRIDEKLNELS